VLVECILHSLVLNSDMTGDHKCWYVVSPLPAPSDEVEICYVCVPITELSDSRSLSSHCAFE
jgi:hypothetical protein